MRAFRENNFEYTAREEKIISLHFAERGKKTNSNKREKPLESKAKILILELIPKITQASILSKQLLNPPIQYQNSQIA